MTENAELLKSIAGFYTTAEYSTGRMDDTITVTIHYDTFKHLTEEQLEKITGLLEQEMKKAANELIGVKNGQ
jgi:hypothetical protein